MGRIQSDAENKSISFLGSSDVRVRTQFMN